MREVDVAPPLEVHKVEPEDDDGYSHAKRGEKMRGYGSATNVGHVRWWNADGKKDILDVEPWDKLCECRINGLIVWYKVVRLGREGEMLGLLRSKVKVMSSKKKRPSDDAHRSFACTSKSRSGSGKRMLSPRVPAVPAER